MKTEPENGWPPGTWLRFQRNGRLTIGVVEYSRHNTVSFGGRWVYITDRGDVKSEYVLEVRQRSGGSGA